MRKPNFGGRIGVKNIEMEDIVSVTERVFQIKFPEIRHGAEWAAWGYRFLDDGVVLSIFTNERDDDYPWNDTRYTDFPLLIELDGDRDSRGKLQDLTNSLGDDAILLHTWALYRIDQPDEHWYLPPTKPMKGIGDSDDKTP